MHLLFCLLIDVVDLFAYKAILTCAHWCCSMGMLCLWLIVRPYIFLHMGLVSSIIFAHNCLEAQFNYKLYHGVVYAQGQFMLCMTANTENSNM